MVSTDRKMISGSGLTEDHYTKNSGLGLQNPVLLKLKHRANQVN